VSPGGDHTCAVTTEHHLFCWGYNALGQVGDGTTTHRLIPVPVSGELRVEAMNAGLAHNCAVTLDGRGYCWGYGSKGQLGNGQNSNSAIPVLVADAP
jgi:alpha-tubulin suppressor-like RCC1 family protein